MEPATRILMVVKEAEARAAYEEALQNIGASYDVAGSFQELLRMSINNSYSGLLIDLLTLVRSSKEEKSIAYDCLNYYPSLRVKWDARTKSMSLSPLEHAVAEAGEATLSHFIEQKCKPFGARSLRKFPRKETCLSLLLSGDSSCPASSALRTFTVNISEGGAFVQTVDPLEKGETVWLRYLELPDLDPVQALVCWRIQWGACRSIPGMGVMYSGLSAGQAEALKKMGNL
jgi:Tfp pilus assembly protein PilZ